MLGGDYIFILILKIALAHHHCAALACMVGTRTTTSQLRHDNGHRTFYHPFLKVHETTLNGEYFGLNDL